MKIHFQQVALSETKRNSIANHIHILVELFKPYLTFFHLNMPVFAYICKLRLGLLNFCFGVLIFVSLQVKRKFVRNPNSELPRSKYRYKKFQIQVQKVPSTKRS